MSLLPTGIQAIAQGVGKYVTDVNKMADAVISYGNTVTQVAAKTAASAMNTPFQAPGAGGNAISSLGRDVSAFIDVLSGGSGVLGLFAGALGNMLQIAGGFIIRDVFGAIARQIKDVIGAAVEAAGSFQQLEIRLSSLEAREIKHTQGVTDMSQAYQMAVEPAKELLNWVSQMAVRTPFNAQDIADAIAMSMAFGLNTEQAKSLTFATGDWVSAMGMGADRMLMTIRTLGVMRSEGKITGMQLRALARDSFLPVNDILEQQAKDLGVADDQLKQFTEDMRSGGTDVDGFIAAFVKLAETDFAGQMDRMSRTLIGVKNNIKDFFQVVMGTQLLGPIFNRFTSVASDALNALLSPAVQKASILIGETLGRAFDTVWPAVQKFWQSIVGLGKALGIAAPSVETFAGIISMLADGLAGGITALADFIDEFGTKFARGMEDVAGQALSWGANIVIQLARGIIMGAVGALTAAMNWISGLLASWLSPGSPPKVAPEIDVWGAEAFTEFLKGFGLADFSVLDSVGGMVKRALSTLVDIGKLAPDLSGDIFAHLQMDLASLVDQFEKTGTVNQEMLNKIIQGTGMFGAEIGSLIVDQLKLTSALKEQAAAEARLKAAQDALTQSDQHVSKATKEYNQLLRSGASKEALAAKLKEINAAESARDVAAKNVTQAKKDVDAAKERVDAMNEQVKIQEKLIQQLLDFVEAQKKAADAETGAGGGGGGGGGLPGGEGGGFPPIPLPNFEDFGKKIRDNIDKILADAKKQILDGLKGLWDSLVQSVTDGMAPVIARFQEAWARLKEILIPILETIRNALFSFIIWMDQQIKDFVNFAIGWWQRHGDSVLFIWNALWTGLTAIVTGGILFIEALIGAGLDVIRTWWIAHGAEVMRILGLLWEWIKLTVMSGMEIVGDIIDLVMLVIQGNWQEAWNKVGEIFGEFSAWLQISWLLLSSAMIKFIGVFGSTVVSVITGLWTGVKGITIAIWTLIYNGLVAIVTNLNNWLHAKWEAFKAWWQVTWTAIQIFTNTLVSNMAAAIVAKVVIFVASLVMKFNELKTKAETTFSGMVTAIVAKVVIFVASLVTKFNELKTKAETTFSGMIASVIAAIATMVGTVIATIATMVGSVGTKIQELKTKFDTTITAIKTGVSGGFAGIVSEVQGAVGKLPGIVSGFVGAMVSAGRNLITGVASGITSGAGAIQGAIRSAISAAIAAAKARLGIKSPSKVFAEFGNLSMEGYSVGVTKNLDKAIGAINKATTSIVSTASVAVPGVAAATVTPTQTPNTYTVSAGSVSPVVNINFGGVTINNGMDLAVFDAEVRRIVRSEI